MDDRITKKPPIRKVHCDRCDADITELFLHPEAFCKTIKDDYEVQYIRCPKCGAKYQIITSDGAMRELIKMRLNIENRIKDAFDRHLKESTIRTYIRQRDNIIDRQKQLNVTLYKIGQQILEEGDC